MFDSETERTFASSGTPFSHAYQRLVEDLERALWEDGAGGVSTAYDEYTSAYSEALSDPLIYERVSGALRQLTDALERALQRTDAQTLVDEAVDRYLHDVAAAWPQLHGDAAELESLVAVAAGMVTIAWLRGLGASGLIGPFGATDLFSTTPFGANTATNGRGVWDPGDYTAAAGGEETSSSSPFAASDDDDGIVWQELSVGDDGQIVQRAAPPKRASGAPERDAADAGARTAGPRRDPVQIVERAYARYAEGLRATGVRSTPGGHSDPAPPAGGAATGIRSDLEERSTELTAAYLRLAQGVGSVPEVFLSYARFLGSASELVEQELELVRTYERLITPMLRGGRPAQVRQAADEHYRRFLAEVRDAWAQLDPATLSPEQLAELAQLTARAAALNETATSTGLRPMPG